MAEAKKSKGKAPKPRAGKQACPKCGPGTLLAEHSTRVHCGKCGYTRWKQ